MNVDEQELESDSTMLYPTVADSEDEEELETEPGGSTYLFPTSEFEPSTSDQPTKGESIRNMIVQDMISLLMRRVLPNKPKSPRDYVPPPVKHNHVLTRDEIIERAMEQAYLSWRPKQRTLHTQPLLQRADFNRKPKVPPIKATDDPDLRELIQKGRSQGYSDAAILKTRRDNNTRRLLIPSKEEAETVDVWRLEEKYRTSINRLKGYSL